MQYEGDSIRLLTAWLRLGCSGPRRSGGTVYEGCAHTLSGIIPSHPYQASRTVSQSPGRARSTPDWYNLRWNT